ncbi:MAG TPA: prepilin-type N-terminal cleavage/methylation domain-containing protein [Tepidisphaeraceae bacterium]|jgi:prepilin-type N-terminal cleavage/methylation domain-containing protein|nr:prepilin-type N-terminal cleavage/methylation domain-containing protein [Tepidisphaeraceae bacterium]
MKRNGFTLTELLISIAIALVLIIGIATVFSLTGQTIGAGMALSATTRDQRAAQTVFSNDFAGLASTNPGLVIWSGTTAGYLDPATRDQDPTRDAGMTGRTLYRTDRIGMFVTGEFRRQSGNVNFLTSDMSGEQAYVWYGHLMLPDNGGAFFYNGNASQPILPGSMNPNAGSTFSTNPNNYFARQWTLGRVALLMKQKTPTNVPVGSRVVLDNQRVEQVFIDDDAADMSPFEYASPATNDPATGPKPRVEQSRYDLVGLNSDSADVFPYLVAKLTANASWWDSFNYRYQADPFPMRPLDSAGAAKTAPVFLPGCTDFRVEFAGDFDGVAGIDKAMIDPDGPGAGTIPPMEHIRWYGLARDVNADGDLNDPEDVTWPYASGGTSAAQNVVSGTPTVFAWGPGTDTAWPSLIRITYTLQDAQGRLNNPQPVEMIFSVKP